MKDSPTVSRKCLLDPDPADWWTELRLQQLTDEFSTARSSLAISGLLPIAVKRWIRQQLADSSPLSPAERAELIDVLEPNWRLKSIPSHIGLLESEVPTKLLVSPGCEAWANQQWGHRIETLFLQRKQELDMASCRLLRVSSKGLALELYHRIKANEDDFASIAIRYGEGPESANGGFIPMQPLGSLPLGLGKVLSKLSPGELTQPTRLGDLIAVVQLNDWKPSRLDTTTRQTLLASELELWLSGVMELALDHLMCINGCSSVIP